jgi:nicotinamide mononucleotide (NMN) deamidase PncC
MATQALPHVLTDAAQAIAPLLVERGQTIAVSESAAGGLISAALLSVPGASRYYVGGAVVYTMAAGKAFLEPAGPRPSGMRGATEAFAAYEAENIRVRLGTTWGLGETGAAGPPNPYGDPSGHAWVAVNGPVKATEHILTGREERDENMVAFAAAALQLLRRAVTGAGS